MYLKSEFFYLNIPQELITFLIMFLCSKERCLKRGRIIAALKEKWQVHHKKYKSVKRAKWSF